MTVAMTTFGDIAAMAWLTTHPSQTFALGGYSQGAEAASRVLAQVMTGPLQWARPNLIGGYSFGTRGASAGTRSPAVPIRGDAASPTST